MKWVSLHKKKCTKGTYDLAASPRRTWIKVMFCRQSHAYHIQMLCENIEIVHLARICSNLLNVKRDKRTYEPRIINVP